MGFISMWINKKVSQLLKENNKKWNAHVSLFWQEENDSSAFDELGRLGENMELLPDENTAIIRRERTKSNNKNEQPSMGKREKYGTRGKRHFYCEAEVPDDDHYICE